MIWWLVLAGWVIGALMTFRPTMRAIVGGSALGGLHQVGWDYIAFGIFISTMVVVTFWPFALAFFALQACTRDRDASVAFRFLAGEGKAEKMQRLEREARAREARIHQLERELGIGNGETLR